MRGRVSEWIPLTKSLICLVRKPTAVEITSNLRKPQIIFGWCVKFNSLKQDQLLLDGCAYAKSF